MGKDLEKAEIDGLEAHEDDVDYSSSGSAPSAGHEDIMPVPVTRTSTRCDEKTGPSLYKTLSAVSRVSTAIPLTPPPDGGTQAYLQIVGAIVGIGLPWGVINSWGVCQTYYTTTLLPSYPQSTISWIGSLQITLLFLVGIISGRAADAGYYYPLSFGGMFLQIFAIFMTSLCTEFWQLLLAQGICFGLGAGISFPAIATLVSTYFEKKRALALSLSAAGTSIFGMVFPAVIQQMLPHAGFGWAMRTVAFIMIACYALAIALLRWRLPPRTTGPMLDYSAFRDRPYVLGVLGMFFAFWPLYFAFFYIGVFADTQVGLSASDSINILLVMNGVGIPARIVTGLLADRVFGPLNVQAVAIAVAGVMLFVWIAVHDVPGLYAFSSFYGFFAAGAQGLVPGMISSLSSDITMRGTRIGMAFFTMSWAVLSGPPIAGALISAHNGGFLYAQIWAGLSMCLAVFFLFSARVSKTGFVLRAKA